MNLYVLIIIRRQNFGQFITICGVGYVLKTKFCSFASQFLTSSNDGTKIAMPPRTKNSG